MNILYLTLTYVLAKGSTDLIKLQNPAFHTLDSEIATAPFGLAHIQLFGQYFCSFTVVFVCASHARVAYHVDRHFIAMDVISAAYNLKYSFLFYI